jgi:hypothetical protein
MRWRLALMVVALAWLGPTPDMAAARDAPVDALCGVAPSRIAAAIAKRRFGPAAADAHLLAMNDVTCDGAGRDGGVAASPEHVHMANVAVATTVRGQRLYLIAHVHFSAEPDSSAPEPRIVSVGAMIRWTPLDGDEWRERWCAFVTSVYAAEAHAQGCPLK